MLRYLHTTADFGLTYTRPMPATLAMRAFCDADYAGDRPTRRSSTGYVFLGAGAGIVWRSVLQKAISLSTTEAEYISASATCREAAWLQHLLRDIGYLPTPVALGCDNQSTLTLIRHPTVSNKLKHIDVAHHYARECAEAGTVAFHYIPSAKNVADIFTKLLPTPTFVLHRAALGIGPAPTAQSS